MSEELYGVATLQAHIAGAEYQEFDNSDAAFAYGAVQVEQLGGSQRMTPFVADESRPDTWHADTRDWTVTVKRWR